MNSKTTLIAIIIAILAILLTASLAFETITFEAWSAGLGVIATFGTMLIGIFSKDSNGGRRIS